MKAPPLLFGGRSPVVAYLRHSMIVLVEVQHYISPQNSTKLTVFPDPLYPTISVSGAWNWMVSP